MGIANLNFLQVINRAAVPVFLASLVLLVGEAHAQTAGGPSALCHVTDGSFTVCPDVGEEWSDIPVSFFPESNAYLYADQADLDPVLQSVHPVTGEVSDLDTFVLMYDECARTTPLGPDEYFLINFDTVEVEFGLERLERYTVHVFADGTIIFIEDGELQTDQVGEFRLEEIDGQRGDVGFGPSPTCAFDHVIVEYQIVLATAGGNSYSPDPSFWGATPPEPPDCGEGETRVSLLVNVLSGVSVSDDQIDELVGETNNLLDQAGTCADFDSSNVVRNASDQGNNDSNVNRAERDRSRTECVNELNSSFGGGKGYKLTIINEFDDVTAEAISLHRPDIPCTFLRVGGANPLGNTTAHEFAHVFTLGPGHLIDDNDTPDPGDDVRADSGGHSSDTNNLMHAAEEGTQLTDDQIDEIRMVARRRAQNTEHAGWTDDLGDVSQGFIDLYIGSLFAEDLTSDLEISINLLGLHPDSDVDTKFELFFDTDNDEATGGTFGSFAGVDQVVEIALQGRFPFTAPMGSMTASLIDVDQGTATGLTPGSVEGIQEIIESDPPTADVVLDAINQSVPLPALGLSAQQVPVGIRATNLDTGEFDEASFMFNLSVGTGLGAIRPGFDANILARNDDGSTGLVPIGFPANFFGTNFSSLFVNNNGNVTFDAALGTFTPFDLTSTGRVIIAPFFADVDTRSAGDPVRYGPGTVDGRSAFGVSWRDVDCFASSPSRTVRNFFQVILIDRSDVVPGDFDIEFNYDQIEWETGGASGGTFDCQGGSSARAGFSNGTGDQGRFFELPGSGVNGAFLDSNLETGLIHNNLNSDLLGRYLFPVRDGMPGTERDTDGDGVPDELDNCSRIPNPIQTDSDLNGIGDACQEASTQHSTAAFLEARLDGTSTAEPTGLAVEDEPGLVERLIRIVEFRVAEGLTDSAEELTQNLVDSLVDVGLVDEEQADELVAEVIGALIVTVAIDIKPGSDINPIKLQGNGVIPVAILTTDAFDATTVDPLSVEFGPQGALEAHGRGHIEDFDNDGDLDLVLHFAIQEAGIACGDTSASLTGESFGGAAVEGSVAIRTIRCE